MKEERVPPRSRSGRKAACPRLVKTEIPDPHLNVALEEAIFRRQGALTVRIWENPSSVIIGRAQLASEETSLDLCEEFGIPVVRRFTAGGAVYNGPGNLNWSIFVGRSEACGPRDDEGQLRGEERMPRYVWDVREIFRQGASFVSAILSRSGFEARLEEPNTIVTKEGKIGGMAAYLSRDAFLCHGTLLLDADLELARRLTTPSPVELERRYVRSRPRVMANTGLGKGEFIDGTRAILAEMSGEEVIPSPPSSGERSLSEELLSRYSDRAWNYGDPFLVTSSLTGGG